MYELADAGLVTANRICAAISAYRVLPVLLFLLLLLFALGALTRLLLALVLSSIQLANSVFVSVFTQ